MWGWLMAAAERASSRKSSRNFGSCARSSRKTLIATSDLKVGSNARKTVPIPPCAISSIKLKWPSFDESAIEVWILLIPTPCASFGYCYVIFGSCYVKKHDGHQFANLFATAACDERRFQIGRASCRERV